jgi:hypothetical protein
LAPLLYRISDMANIIGRYLLSRMEGFIFLLGGIIYVQINEVLQEVKSKLGGYLL